MTMTDEGERTCPLCVGEMDLIDQQLKPCKCGYDAVFFLQFWKRKNSTLLARWQICYSVGVESAYKYMDTERSSFHSSVGSIKFEAKKSKKEKFQREEWFGHKLRFRNDAIYMIISLIKHLNHDDISK